jgi:uncharacterized membrane protein YeaQ/YmgE (transglycosylase-associated protein family)
MAPKIGQAPGAYSRIVLDRYGNENYSSVLLFDTVKIACTGPTPQKPHAITCSPDPSPDHQALLVTGLLPAGNDGAFSICRPREGGGTSTKLLPFEAWRRMSMHIIGVIVIGFLAGLVAKLLMPGRDPGGFIVTILLGIAGAFVATYLGQAVGWYRADEGAGFIGAIVGAIIVLAIYRMIAGRRTVR